MSHFELGHTGRSLMLLAASMAATLLAPGCKPSPSATDLVPRQPGSWQVVHTVTAFDATGVTGGMADMAAAGKASIGKPDEGSVCLTSAETARDTLRTRLDEAMRMGPEWKTARNAITGGKVDYAAEMDDPVQGKATLSISGEISPVSTNLIVTTDAREPAPGKGHIRTVARYEAARLGNC